MNHTIKKRDCKIYSLHVEMRGDEQSIANNKTSVWLSSLNDGNKTYFDYNIKDLLNRLFDLAKSENLCIYTYDLKYEWNAIIPELINRGFKYSSELTTKTYNDSAADQQRSIIYCASIKPSYLNKVIVFRDLKRMFPLHLEDIAAAFNIQIDLKGINTATNRSEGYVPTEKELTYCQQYTDTIFAILNHIDSTDDDLFWSSYTIASYSIKKILNSCYAPSRGNNYNVNAAFRKSYPRYEVKKDAKELKALLTSYEGALTYALPDYQFKEIKGQVLHIDAHQMYPTQVCEHVFPCGKGTYFVGEPTRGKMCLLHIKASYDSVILYARPSLIGLDFGDNIDIWVWDFEIKNFQRCYENFQYKVIEGWAYDFRPFPFKKAYLENYAQRRIARQNGDLFGVIYWKLLNNTSYGKLGERTHSSKIVDLHYEDGKYLDITEDKNIVYYGGLYTYLPVSSCITAYARQSLIDMAFKFGIDKVLYLATDSLFVLLNDETERIWKTVPQDDNIGCWAEEGRFDYAQFVAPNRYKLKTAGENEVKASGFNELSGDVDLINSKQMVKRSFHLNGGVVDAYEEKQMKVLEKYQATYERNVGKEVKDVRN